MVGFIINCDVQHRIGSQRIPSGVVENNTADKGQREAKII
jgi:hypothetical protein